jgi:hypothetical protein
MALRCYKLLENNKMVASGAISKDIVSSIEMRIQNLVQHNARILNGGIIDRGSRRKGTAKNPMDDFLGTGSQSLASSSYSLPKGGRMRDQLENFKNKRASTAVSQSERYQNSEAYRSSMLSKAKEVWTRSGLVDPETGEPVSSRRQQREEVNFVHTKLKE